MEALAVLSLTSTIFQILDFSAKLISKTTDLYVSAAGTLSQNVDVELVAVHFAALVDQLDHQSLPSQDLASICNSCKTISSQLLGILQNLKENTKCKTWKSIKHAVRSMLKNGEIQSLQTRLEMLKNELTTTLVAGLSRDWYMQRVESREHLSRLEATATRLSTMMSAMTVKVDRLEEAQRVAFDALSHDHANQVLAVRQMIERSLRSEAASVTSRLLEELSQRHGGDQMSPRLICDTSHPPSIQESSSRLHSRLEDRHGENDYTQSDPSIVIRRPAQRRQRFLRRSDQHSWFGRTMVSVSEIYIGNELTHVLTECIIIPSPWLFRLGRGVKIQHFRSMAVMEAPNVSLRPLQVLSSRSPIITAINSRDISTIESIIRENRVSPLAVNEIGENLLYLIAAQICHTVGSVFASDKDPTVPEENRLSSQERRLAEQNFYGLRRLFDTILALGVDPAQRSSRGISSLSASKDNPFHQPAEDMIGWLLREYSHKPSWEYDYIFERLLEGLDWTICADDGAGIANALALPYLIRHIDEEDAERLEKWVPLKDDIYYDFDKFFPRRLRIVRYLSSNIKESLADETASRDNPGLAGKVVGYTKQAVQLSLLYASPMKGVHLAGDQASLVRRSVVKEVCAMVEALCSHVDSTEDTMLEWCEEWEVLDIWVQSLQQAGVRIPSKTRKAWLRSKANYNYSDLQGSIDSN
ncbi:hypothetical protein B0T24DRAFT_697080 [Lasiosphaeria ovina]|uniref:Fungal N-terminal domain-containing protein n=1 Tax=Lasiosphaeria ovina TaxID=92902 RepID=A0AAE0NFI8_9PEZI|nr:hypothetical protein B0T24DRAFT_697080 [Lasiosphaeria ovina]